MHSRRDFAKMAFGATAACALPLGSALAQPKFNSNIRGVEIAFTSGSLNGVVERGTVRPPFDINLCVQQYIQLGVRNVELANGSFGAALVDTDAGQPPKVMTQAYWDSREALRKWRFSPEALADYTNKGRVVRGAGLNLFCISNTFDEVTTEPEMDRMFILLQALGVKSFHSNQSRVAIGPRLVPYVKKYGIKPSFHTHSNNAEDEIGSPESAIKLMNMSPDFMVCLDIGHFTAGNHDPVAFLKEHHDRITHLHIKDRKRNDGPNVEWGTGDTPIVECLRLVRDRKWPIICSQEREFSGTRGPVEETGRNMDYMRRALES